MIKQLRLTDFQRHASLSLDFTEGLNLIVGPNMAGKSTVQRAILYALFGASALPFTVEQLCRNGSTSTMRVELEFSEWTVERTPKGALLRRTSDKTELASGQAAVTSEVESILGMTGKQFIALRVASQKEAGTLLRAGAQQLAGLIDAITGVDLVSKTLSRAKTERSIADAVVKAIGPALVDAAIEQGQSRIATLGAQLDQLTDQWTQAKSDLLELTQGQTELQARVSQLGRDREYYQTHLRQLEAARAWARKLSESANALEKSKPTVARPEPSQVHASKHEVEELLARKTKISSALTDVSRLSLRISQIRQELAELVEPAEPEEDLHALAEQEQRLRERETEQAQRLVGVIAMLGQSICPTCHQLINSSEEERARLDEDRKTLEAGLEALTQERVSASQRLSAAREGYRQRELVRQARTSKEDTLASFTAMRQEHIDALAALGDPDALAPQITAAQRTSDSLQDALLQWGTWEGQLGQILTQNAEAASQIAQLEATAPPLFDEEAYVAQRDRLNTLDQETTHLREKATHFSQTLQTTQVAQQEAQERLRALEEQKKKAQDAEQRMKGLKELEKYLAENTDRFIEDIWRQILSFSEVFISRATNQQVSKLVRTGARDFAFVENGVQRPVELASGYLEDVLGAALKLALGTALGGKASFLLLDEITAAGQDENALLLTSLLSQAGQQVLLISHRQADAASAASITQIS